MDRKVYFGNATKQLWIPAPQSGLNASVDSYIAQSTLLSGRASIKRSKASHRSFNASWVGSMNTDALEDSVYTVKDFADGLYGTGPFYWLDPYAVDTNLLPPHWAAPMLSVEDWPSLCDVATATLVDTATNTRNYPYKSLRLGFSAAVAEGSEFARIIIPEGYKLHFGWHGEVNSGEASVVLRGYDRDTGTPTDVVTVPLAVTSQIRTNTQMRGNDYSHVDILIKNTDDSTSQIDISGMIAQVLSEFESVEQGGFISGRGTSALEFSSMPNMEYYSAKVNGGQIGISATFMEV